MSNVNESLDALVAIDGAVGAAVVDYESGMVLGTQGGGVDLELAGAGNTQVVKAKMATMESLGIDGGIEDILITLDKQLHIIRPTVKPKGLFIYLVLDKAKANLALARRQVQSIEADLKI